MLTRIYYYIILARVILSFIVTGYSQNRSPVVENIYRFVWKMTEPLLKPLRGLIPSVRMGGGGQLDLSPIIALFIIWALQSIIQTYVNF